MPLSSVDDQTSNCESNRQIKLFCRFYYPIWSGSQEVGGSILAAPKIVRCKTWLSTLESVFLVARIPGKAVGPMYIGRVIPKHVKDLRAPVNKSRVLIPGVTGQIPELLRIAVSYIDTLIAECV